MAYGDFKRADIIAEQQRVLGHCSNPECRRLTIGPSSGGSEVWLTGEAAHIFGRRPGSARYDHAMSDAERASPENMIWLCCNCHHDADQRKLSAEQLHAWRSDAREHARLLFGTSTQTMMAFDCPWCARVVPGTATRCVHCTDVFRAPTDPVRDLFFFLAIALILAIHLILYGASALTQATSVMASALGAAIAAAIVLSRRATLRALAQRRSELFVRVFSEAVDGRAVTRREYRHAHGRAVSAVELARHGVHPSQPNLSERP